MDGPLPGEKSKREGAEKKLNPKIVLSEETAVDIRVSEGDASLVKIELKDPQDEGNQWGGEKEKGRIWTFLCIEDALKNAAVERHAEKKNRRREAPSRKKEAGQKTRFNANWEKTKKKGTSR